MEQIIFLNEKQLRLIMDISFYLVGIFIHLKENIDEKNNFIYYNDFTYYCIKILKISIWPLFISKKMTNYFEELILNNNILGVTVFVAVGIIISEFLSYIVIFIAAIVLYLFSNLT